MKKAGKILLIALASLLALCGCGVSQKAREEYARNQTAERGKIVATSVACMEICEKLDLPLAGVPSTSLKEIPDKYADAVEVGSPMSPDMEILDSLSPDWVLSPSSLQSDLEPKYQAAGYRYQFLDLKSVQGMYTSISQLGELFGCEDKAGQLVSGYEQFLKAYQEKHADKEAPAVLILMGIPGSYIVATENSYVGSLVELAGGKNIYGGTDEEFLSANTEDMLQKNPDIILRTAHALPEEVMEMFAEEFQTNDIWKHFSAVQNGKVYDLTSGLFGMSATFEYPAALEELDQILYPE